MTLPPRRAAACLLLLGLLASGAWAEDEYVAKVIAAARAGDAAALTRLGRSVPEDPWPVVDRLCELGLHAGAPAYARDVPEPHGAALRAYVAALPPELDGVRLALRDAFSLLSADPRAARALLEHLPVPPRSVVAFQRAYLLSRALAKEGKAAAATRAATEATRLANELHWLSAQAQAERQLFTCLFEETRLSEALDALDRSRQAFAQFGALEDLALADRHEGATYLRLGMPHRAVPLLQAALRYFETHGPQYEEGYTRSQLAQAHRRMGTFAPALTHAEIAERQAMEAQDAAGVTYARHQRSAILLDMGKYLHAGDLCEQLLKQEDLDANMTALTLANLAMARTYLGEFKQAEEAYAHALTYCLQRKLAATAGWIHMMRGFTLGTEQAAWDQVLQDAGAALRMLEASSHDAAYAHFVMAVGHLGKKDASRARTHLEQALAIARELDLVDLECFVEVRRTEIALMEGKPKEAISAARKALAAMDLSAAGLADEEGVAVRSQQERSRLFRLWARAARELGDPALEYEALEAGRARTLLLAMGGSHRARGVDLPKKLRDREREAQRDLLAARERLLSIGRSRALKDPVRQKAWQDLKTMRRRFIDVVDEVQRQAGVRGALAYPKRAALKDLQDKLPKHAAVALYEVDREQGYVLLVTRKTAHTRALAPWSTIRSAAERIATSAVTDDPALFRKAASVLRKGLLDALQLPKEITTLYVSPTGPLITVPWPALAPDEDGGPYVWMIPSAQTLSALTAHEPVKGKRVLAVGDPLYERKVRGRVVPWSPGSGRLVRLRESAREARQAAKGGGVLLLQEDATETRVKAELSGEAAFDLVLLACHGVIDAESPSLTSLALGPSDHDDGFLTSTEVFGLTVRSNLVVLSACDVGRAQHAEGAGVLGLVRAFMAAGTPRVLASLWPADEDASAVLMAEFLARRAAGALPQDALCAAQAKVRSTKDARGRLRHAAPYYWAGWVLWGAAR